MLRLLVGPRGVAIAGCHVNHVVRYVASLLKDNNQRFRLFIAMLFVVMRAGCWCFAPCEDYMIFWRHWKANCHNYGKYLVLDITALYLY